MLRRIAELTSRPPFTGQLGYAEDRTRLGREIASAEAEFASPHACRALADAIEDASRRDPGNAFLLFSAAGANLQAGDRARALELNGRLAALEPASAEDAAQRAFLLEQLGRFDEAEKILLRSAASDPYYFQTYSLLANLWNATGRIPKALEYFAALTARMPDSSAVRLAYAEVLGAGGDWSGAEQQWREVLRSSPDNEVALASLVQRLYERRRGDDAVDLMLKAHAYNPRDLPNNERLEMVFEEKGDLKATVTYMRAMADSGPVKAVMHLDLALNLLKLGRGTRCGSNSGARGRPRWPKATRHCLHGWTKPSDSWRQVCHDWEHPRMSTRILGISAFYHDSAAALVVDGRIVAAAQEERFTRRKHDADFPAHAIASCLAQGGIGPEDLDHVVFYEKPFLKFERLLETYLATAPASFRSFLKAMPVWFQQKLHLPRELHQGLGGRYRHACVFTEHHEAHAASAFYPSPFEEAAILTVDGVGEWATASLGRGAGRTITLTHELDFPHSLGLLYSAFTYYCGFKVNSGEYKLMGLAPYGRARVRRPDPHANDGPEGRRLLPPRPVVLQLLPGPDDDVAEVPPALRRSPARPGVADHATGS